MLGNNGNSSNHPLLAQNNASNNGAHYGAHYGTIAVNINTNTTTNTNPNGALQNNMGNRARPCINKDEIYGGLIVTLAVGVLLACIFLPVSFWYIPYDKYAFDRYKFGLVDTSKVLTSGRYFRSLLHEPIYFPATYQAIEFVHTKGTQMTIFTTEGYMLALDIKFYYKLPINNLASIYSKYSTSYENAIISQAKLVIKDLAGTVNKDNTIDTNAAGMSLLEYIVNRKVIQKNFAEAVSRELYNTIGVEVPVKYFQMLTTHIPDNMADQYLKTVVQWQNNLIESNQQVVTAIVAETDTMVSKINALTNYTLASATNEANKIIVNQQSEANNIVSTARNTGLTNILHTLNITDSSMKHKFIEYCAILESAGANVMMGVNTNAVFLTKP